MATKPTLTKTGECYYRDEAGALWLAESFVSATGECTTTDTLVEPATDTSTKAENALND